MCAEDPAGVKALDQFLKSHSTLKGTGLQDAAVKDNFQPSFVALALFPQVVSQMARDLNATTKIGQAFTADRTAVFASIQRLRKHLPKGSQIVAGLWPSDEAAEHDEEGRKAIGADLLAGSLEGAVDLCVQAAVQMDEVQAELLQT